eukprot:4738776-Amphidinium_carterae.1
MYQHIKRRPKIVTRVLKSGNFHSLGRDTHMLHTRLAERSSKTKHFELSEPPLVTSSVWRGVIDGHGLDMLSVKPPQTAEDRMDWSVNGGYGIWDLNRTALGASGSRADLPCKHTMPTKPPAFI